MKEKRKKTSKYKGVYTDKNGCIHAQITVAYQRMYLGQFETEENAAFAYNEAVIRYRGLLSSAKLNKIEGIDESLLSEKLKLAKQKVKDIHYKYAPNCERDITLVKINCKVINYPGLPGLSIDKTGYVCHSCNFVYVL